MRVHKEEHGKEPPNAFPAPRAANAAAGPRDAVAFGASDNLVAPPGRPSMTPPETGRAGEETACPSPERC